MYMCCVRGPYRKYYNHINKETACWNAQLGSLLGREKTVFMAHTGLSFQPVSYDLEHFNNREKKKKLLWNYSMEKCLA